MSHIFRLHTGATDTYQGWQESLAFPYDSAARNTIEDPNGADAKYEITSIPSPFARIDLVKAAFREVNSMARQDRSNLDGQTIFHKMVSDSLDVGEIFLNLNKYKGQIQVITCDMQNVVGNLKNSPSACHRDLGDVLDKFLISDAYTYNFGQMQNIYLLNYINGPAPLNIIGATSPATLFFSTANDLSYVKDIYFSQNDKPFDANRKPLFKRDHDYVEMLWTLKQTIPGFSALFPEIDEYLDLTFLALTDNAFKNQLTNIIAVNPNLFQSINVTFNAQSFGVDVLGKPIYQKKQGLRAQSEFTIKPTANTNGTLPLVLPIESGNKYASLHYVSGDWGKENKVPYSHNEPDLQSRTLPFDGTQYPWITIGDLLEDNLMHLPLPLNSKHYYDGNVTGGESQINSYLLPLKPLFFKYFTPDFLGSKMPDQKKAIEMKVLAGQSVDVTLRIPIIGNSMTKYVEYRRTYYAAGQADSNQNSGRIRDSRFKGFVMPLVRFRDEQEAIYTVNCTYRKSNGYTLSFYKEGDIVNCWHDTRDINRISDFPTDTYTLEKSHFDFIQVKAQNDGVCNVIVPRFVQQNPANAFEFAVDFGTSNTHIEYRKKGTSGSSPFAANTDELCSMFFLPERYKLNNEYRVMDPAPDEDQMMMKEYLPAQLSANTDYHFPTRTALTCAKTIDWVKRHRVYELTNLNFAFNVLREVMTVDETRVNIKWGNAAESPAVMQAYINNLLLLIRNKVVVNDGILNKTEITWFYPNSMSPNRVNQLHNAWQNGCKAFLSGGAHLSRMSESVAPVQYYFSTMTSVDNLVSIDIGGGTTDVAFSRGGKVECTTSFRFATNNLFEDSLSVTDKNGIVDTYVSEYEKLLGDGCGDLLQVLDSLRGRPADIASFLFSLKDNSLTKELADDIRDFNVMMYNKGHFKVELYLYFVTIVYHVAQISKVKGFGMPRHIAFSGNGSRVLNALTTDTTILSNLAKEVFQHVLGVAGSNKLDIVGLDGANSPKEATCKGGLLKVTDATLGVETVILKDSNGTLVSEKDTYATLENRQVVDDILKSVETFLDYALETLPKKMNLDANLAIPVDKLKIAKECCGEDLKTYLDKGIAMSEMESGDKENRIGEPLSFYPIKGMLQEMSIKLQTLHS